MAAGSAALFAALTMTSAGAPARGNPYLLSPAVAAVKPAPKAAAADLLVPAAAPADPGIVRITAPVGPDLTRSLQAAGVGERQGRAYVAAIATAIDTREISIADRFHLVIRREEGRLGELVFAGLDRVGRSDLALMKWTDGREVRWIDAEGLDPSSSAMGMPVAGRVSSGFGQRRHPILGQRRMHTGIDVAARSGAPIVAAASGRVIAAGWNGGYGRQVALAHGEGLQTTYAHMSRIAVAYGAHVRQGQVIGYVGSTGLSTGPHLHYEVRRDGRLVNPLSVKLTESPLQGEELHAFRATLRGVLTGRSS